MTVFVQSRANAIVTSMNALFERSLLHIRPPNMVPRDIYDMLVRPSDMSRLQRIESEVKELELSGLATGYTMVNTKLPLPNKHAATTEIKMKVPMQGLLPAYYTNGPHSETPPHPEVVNWLERRYMIGVKFARAVDVFNKLNYQLSTLAQMKMFFNGVTALLEMEESSRKMAARAREANMPTRFVSLPRELRDGGVEATQTIAQALLFPNEAVGETSLVKFTIAKYGTGKVDVPWGREINVW